MICPRKRRIVEAGKFRQIQDTDVPKKNTAWNLFRDGGRRSKERRPKEIRCRKGLRHRLPLSQWQRQFLQPGVSTQPECCSGRNLAKVTVGEPVGWLLFFAQDNAGAKIHDSRMLRGAPKNGLTHLNAVASMLQPNVFLLDHGLP